MNVDDVLAQHLHESHHPRRIGNDNAVVNVELGRIGRKFAGGQDCVLGLSRPLVLCQFVHVVVPPCAPVLKIVDDDAAFLAVVNYNVFDIGPSFASADAVDLVTAEFCLERIKQLDLCPLTKLISSLLLKLPLEVLQLVGEFAGFFRMLGILTFSASTLSFSRASRACCTRWFTMFS